MVFAAFDAWRVGKKLVHELHRRFGAHIFGRPRICRLSKVLQKMFGPELVVTFNARAVYDRIEAVFLRAGVRIHHGHHR